MEILNKNNTIEIKKIGIFGATGFIGSNLVKYLYDNLSIITNNTYEIENNKKIILKVDEIKLFFSKTRWNNLIKNIEHPIFSYEKVNIFSKEELENKTKNLDLIINCAGIVSFSKKDIKKLWDVNVIGAKNILEVAIKNNVKKFVHISSISILNLSDNSHILNENDIGITDYEKRFHSFSSNKEILTFNELIEKGDLKYLKYLKNPYADTKLAGYIVCKEIAINSNIEFINVLPGTVIGKGDDNFSFTKLVYNIDKNLIFGLINGYTSYIDSYELANGIFNAAIFGKNLESYIISGNLDNNIKYSEIIKLINETLNKIYNKKRLKIFINIPKLIAYPISFISELLGSKNLNLPLIKSGFIQSKINNEKSKNEIYFKTSKNIKESIFDLCSYYKENDIKEIIKNKKYFFFIKKYFIDPWVRRNGIIFINGIENIYNSKKRVYVVNHPTTFDIYTIINTSEDNFYIPVDYKAFKVPIVGYILTQCGFVQVYPKENKHILPAMSKKLDLCYPVFNSIRGGDVTLGLDERIRTGAAVMADLNEADLIPYHIYIEKGKKRLSKIFAINFKFYPYTYYKDAIIYINILPPIKCKDYHKENITKDDYYKIMENIDKMFIEKDRDMDILFEKNKEDFKKIKRKGGSKITIKY